MNWVILYMQMNLTTPKDVTKADRPSLSIELQMMYETMRVCCVSLSFVLTV
jgi:hypothetical protein